MGLVVQASLAAVQLHMALAMLKPSLLSRPRGQACCAGLERGLQGSPKYRQVLLIMGLVVQAFFAAGQHPTWH